MVSVQCGFRFFLMGVLSKFFLICQCQCQKIWHLQRGNLDLLIHKQQRHNVSSNIQLARFAFIDSIILQAAVTHDCITI